MYEPILPLVLETVYNITKADEDQGAEGLNFLADIAEAEPKFYKTNFSNLFLLVIEIYKITTITQGTKKIGTELIITIVERCPQYIRNDNEKIKQLLDMLFFHMIDISLDVDDDWKRPPEGFNEDIEEDEDFETTRFGMNAIDRLISCIGDKEMLPNLSFTV